MNINKSIVMGILPRDPQVITTPKGTVLKFTVATTTGFIGADGAEKKYTDYVNVSAFGKVAERYKSIRQNNIVLVEGKLKTDTYEKEGKKVYEMSLNASTIQLDDGSATNESTPSRPPSTKAPAPAPDVADDEVPF